MPFLVAALVSSGHISPDETRPSINNVERDTKSPVSAIPKHCIDATVLIGKNIETGFKRLSGASQVANASSINERSLNSNQSENIN